MSSMFFRFGLASLLVLGACGSAPSREQPPPLPTTWGSTWVNRTGPWPSAECDAKAGDLLGRMTLAEKVGQMTQAERGFVAPGDIRTYFLGALLSGAGTPRDAVTPAEWAAMVDHFHAETLTTRLKIPLIYGVDAVHGDGLVVGATIFPHAIGLGASRDTALIREVGAVTALEVAGTGVDWTFSPVVAAARDERWGRTYETFSESPDDAGTFGAALIQGYQGDRLGGNDTSVLACAKHFAGDGATAMYTSTMPGARLDRGDVLLSDDDFMRLAVEPYRSAIAAGVGSIMISYSSFQRQKMHGNAHLITDVLKGELGFRGFVVSDYQGIQELPGTYAEQVAAGANAGIDLFMEPENWKRFIATLTEVVQNGDVPLSRIDDAVRRILTVKCEAGLFEKAPARRDLTSLVGAPEHRELARQAVRESLVLLKNDPTALPLSKSTKIVVAGVGATSLTRQAGGWTVRWQGANDEPFAGTTLLDAVRAALLDPAGVTYSADGTQTAGAEVALLVMSEPAYAEWFGDTATLEVPNEDALALANLRASGLPIVVVLLSGRPLIIEPLLDQAAAWVAAWLPGSAGEGVTDVLFGDAAPTGKLSHSWPRTVAQVPINVGDTTYDPLFPYGFGLTYAAP